MLIARSTNAESTNSGCNDLSVVMSYFWVLLLLSSFNFLGATITIKQSPKHCAAFFTTNVAILQSWIVFK
jgi:hypothetical protein